jgi:hypothetical protein
LDNPDFSIIFVVRKENKTMYWKFTYMWWHSVHKDIMFVKADTEEEAYKRFDSCFGYEEVDCYGCEQVTEQDVLKATVKGYED